MFDPIKMLLAVANDELATHSIFANHTIAYDTAKDRFKLYVEINGVNKYKEIKGLDGDFADPNTDWKKLNELAKQLIKESDDQLIEIIYSN